MTRKARKLIVYLSGLGMAAASIIYAQTSFEVASIKAHPGLISFAAGPMIRGSRVTGTAITLLDLIAFAYGVRYDQVLGAPGWVTSEHFDIEAKAGGDGALAKNEAMQKVQALLADRFQLVVHRETRETPVFALVIAKNGAKLKESAADATGSSVRASVKGMHMEAAKTTMEQLARQLSLTAGRPVLDRTGLTAHYAFTLDWMAANVVPPPDSDDVPSLFAALQEQLGLKLEPVQAPIEMLVIDRAERPSGN